MNSFLLIAVCMASHNIVPNDFSIVKNTAIVHPADNFSIVCIEPAGLHVVKFDVIDKPKKCSAACDCETCECWPDCDCGQVDCNACQCCNWKKGPLPPGTWNWGGLVTTGNDPYYGFYFADFKGDRAEVLCEDGKYKTIKAEDVAWYNNCLQIPTKPLKATTKPEQATPKQAGPIVITLPGGGVHHFVGDGWTQETAKAFAYSYAGIGGATFPTYTIPAYRPAFIPAVLGGCAGGNCAGGRCTSCR